MLPEKDAQFSIGIIYGEKSDQGGGGLQDETSEKERLIQNLTDAGLCPEEIERFLCCHDQNKQAAQLKILTQYRGKLLGMVRDGQEKLYCLDYLIRKLKTKK